MVQLRPCVAKGNSPARARWVFLMDRGRHCRGCTQGCTAGATFIANEILFSASMRSRLGNFRHHPLSEIRKPA
jgi:hypothetical protein